MRAECLVRCEFSTQICYVGGNRDDGKGGGDGDGDKVVAMLAAVLVMAVVMTMMVVATCGGGDAGRSGDGGHGISSGNVR